MRVLKEITIDLLFPIDFHKNWIKFESQIHRKFIGKFHRNVNIIKIFDDFWWRFLCHLNNCWLEKRLDSLHSSVNFNHYRLFKHSTTQHNFLSFNNEFQCWKHYTSVIYTSFYTRETENEIYFSDFNDTFKQLILFVMSQSHREIILSSSNFVHISIIHIFTIVHSESLNVTTKFKFFLIAAFGKFAKWNWNLKFVDD